MKRTIAFSGNFSGGFLDVEDQQNGQITVAETFEEFCQKIIDIGTAAGGNNSLDITELE